MANHREVNSQINSGYDPAAATQKEIKQIRRHNEEDGKDGHRGRSFERRPVTTDQRNDSVSPDRDALTNSASARTEAEHSHFATDVAVGIAAMERRVRSENEEKAALEESGRQRKERHENRKRGRSTGRDNEDARPRQKRRLHSKEKKSAAAAKSAVHYGNDSGDDAADRDYISDESEYEDDQT